MDFLAKPVDPDHLLLLVARALEQRRIVTENLLMKEELAVRRGAPQLVGEDPSLRKVFASLQRAAATDATVLLEGESGTGKELFARSLHALSPRADAPFVAINCAAIPENAARDRAVRLREGGVHRRGARASRASSRWRTAARCSSTRSAICRCRSRRRSCARSRRSGSSASAAPRSVQVDVRLVAATNAGLQAPRSPRERFREDLYFRLSVFPITVPPLRERPGDIPVLARYFVDRFCRDLKKKPLVAFAGGARAAAGLSLARQRPRAAELHRARGDPRRRRHASCRGT